MTVSSHHGHQGWRDAPNASSVEVEKGEPTCVVIAEDVASDQEPRNHKEHVHPDEATRQEGFVEVKQDDRQDGDSSQPVDVRSDRWSLENVGSLLPPIGRRRFLRSLIVPRWRRPPVPASVAWCRS